MLHHGKGLILMNTELMSLDSTTSVLPINSLLSYTCDVRMCVLKSPFPPATIRSSSLNVKNEAWPYLGSVRLGRFSMRTSFLKYNRDTLMMVLQNQLIRFVKEENCKRSAAQACNKVGRSSFQFSGVWQIGTYVFVIMLEDDGLLENNE